jgi:predicted nucleic acid-binding protein
MSTAIDSNVIVALWDLDKALSSVAQSALDAAMARGGLVISAPVFAELMAAPGRSETFVDSFCKDTGIIVDWNLEEALWRIAGQAFQGYALRRRKQRGVAPRRVLADFLIGAHALRRRYDLLTLDDHLYRAAFPDLSLVTI